MLQTFHELAHEAERLVFLLRQKQKTLVTVESCTGGLLAAAITSVSGASDVFWGGWVVYANAAKEAWVSVNSDLLKQYGAVSEEVAYAMAEGGILRSSADLSISVTGIAGPKGGTSEKPEGLVYFAGKSRAGINLKKKQLFGAQGRHTVQLRAAHTALGLIEELVHDMA